ncbi:MAG: hypothetical protein WAK04_07090, partial [Xanthobacteraceae bacterium]
MRQAVRRHRRRRQHGIYRRPIDVTDAQFDALEERGYLDPDRRGDRALPVKSMDFPGAMDLLKKYQARAPGAGTDPLGYYMPVWAYADLQVLGQAIVATRSPDDDKLADYMRDATFKTIVGDVKFGPKGEWAEERTLAAQFQNITSNSIDEFRDPSKEKI